MSVVSNSLPPPLLIKVDAILLLDGDGNRLAGKYYGDFKPADAARSAPEDGGDDLEGDGDIAPSQSVEQLRASFERQLHSKIGGIAARPNAAEIVTVCGKTAAFCGGTDGGEQLSDPDDVRVVHVGPPGESELVLAHLVEGMYAALSRLMGGRTHRRMILDNLEMVLILIDDHCDRGLILETNGSKLARSVLLLDGHPDAVAAAASGYPPSIIPADQVMEQEHEDYINLEKATVLQEARRFYDPTFVRDNPRKCCTIITQLFHLANMGQCLNNAEATDVFFGVTQLFSSVDASLRRMVYLYIKEYAATCDPSNVIIVFNALIKDFTCDVVIYRANALRALVDIFNAAMLWATQRYVKEGIIDSTGRMRSATLVSATHLFERNQEMAAIVKGWIDETMEAARYLDVMVQPHALQLLYQIKKDDRLAMQELVTQLSQCLKSPLALVLLVRYTAQLLNDEVDEGQITSGASFQSGSTFAGFGYAFLKKSLRHKSEMVAYEAAKAICALHSINDPEPSHALKVLQLFLSSPKPAVRFAAIKINAVVGK